MESKLEFPCGKIVVIGKRITNNEKLHIIAEHVKTCPACKILKYTNGPLFIKDTKDK